MWAELNGAVCWDAHAESRPPKEGATVRWQPCSTLCGMFVQPFYFVSYYFYWIEYDDYFFHFQETYNSRLRERYGDDPSTHPDFDSNLWMEVGSSGGPDKNRVSGSPTLWSRTCGQPVVSQPLGAPNQYRAPNLSLWPCSNTRLSSPKNTTPISRVYTTQSESWTASPNGHEHDITEWWYMCASFFLAV